MTSNSNPKTVFPERRSLISISKLSMGLKWTIISTLVTCAALLIGAVNSIIATRERISKSEATLIEVKSQMALLMQYHFETQRRVYTTEQKTSNNEQEIKKAVVVAKNAKDVLTHVIKNQNAVMSIVGTKKTTPVIVPNEENTKPQ